MYIYNYGESVNMQLKKREEIRVCYFVFGDYLGQKEGKDFEVIF